MGIHVLAEWRTRSFLGEAEDVSDSFSFGAKQRRKDGGGVAVCIRVEEDDDLNGCGKKEGLMGKLLPGRAGRGGKGCEKHDQGCGSCQDGRRGVQIGRSQVPD